MTHHEQAHEVIEPLPEVCDACHTVIDDGSELYALVPDSSVTHPHDPAQDGTRVIAACSRPHLQTLRQRCVQRPFIDEELWAGKIRRFLHHHPGHTFTLEELAQGT